jgi:hypothetical protein
VDLNHDNEMVARAGLVGDQALSAREHVGVALALFDRDLDVLGGEVATPLSFRLVLSACVAQCGLCERDLPTRPVGCAPYDGAESPMLVMNSALSINSHRSNATHALGRLARSSAPYSGSQSSEAHRLS